MLARGNDAGECSPVNSRLEKKACQVCRTQCYHITQYKAKNDFSCQDGKLLFRVTNPILGDNFLNYPLYFLLSTQETVNLHILQNDFLRAGKMDQQ